MELYQAEWCPFSHRVRQRLTELQLDFCALQVPVRPADRQDMREAVGEDSIPLLVDGDAVIAGDEDILAYLDETYPEPADAGEHRAKARAEVKDFEEVRA
jgi:glutaredoxin 3